MRGYSPASRSSFPEGFRAARCALKLLAIKLRIDAHSLSGAPMSALILLAVAGVIVFWFIGAYNSLISLKNQVANAWKQIDVQLKRRHDLIPNLIETVRGAMSFERDTLEAVVAARNQAIAVERGNASVAQTAQAESQLSGALSRLMVVVEAYPDLKATGNVAQLQEELTSTENKISFARQLYNDTATLYNTKQQQFPTNLVAGMAQATPVELWEITDAAERAVPKVDLSMKPGDRSRV
jgi:LemA protein